MKRKPAEVMLLFYLNYEILWKKCTF